VVLVVVVAITVVVVCIERVCIEKVVIPLTVVVVVCIEKVVVAITVVVVVVCIEKLHQSNSVIVSHPKVMCVVYVTFLDIGYNNVPRRKIIVIITIKTIMEVEVIFHEWRIMECL
jgi:hypothetical protein